MTDIDALRKVAEGATPGAFFAANPTAVLDLLDRLQAAEAAVARCRALADEWQEAHERGGNGRHGYHCAEYGDYYADDLRGALGDDA